MSVSRKGAARQRTFIDGNRDEPMPTNRSRPFYMS